MSIQKVSLNDRLDLTKDNVMLNGTQALVRLMLMQKARDTKAGLNTAGYVTGYRGSPLGAVDSQMMRAEKELTAHDVLFQSGFERRSCGNTAVGQSAGGVARRRQVRWCLWPMVRQRAGRGPHRRRDAPCQYGGYQQQRGCADGDG